VIWGTLYTGSIAIMVTEKVHVLYWECTSIRHNKQANYIYVFSGLCSSRSWQKHGTLEPRRRFRALGPALRSCLVYSKESEEEGTGSGV